MLLLNGPNFPSSSVLRPSYKPATMSSSTAAAGKQQPKQPSAMSEAELAQQYNARRSELQSIATKISELEGEAEEHKLVVETLTDAHASTPERKCFRLIGGVLVEKTVGEVLPSLKTQLEGLQQILQTLLKQYNERQQQLSAFVQEHGIVPPNQQQQQQAAIKA